MVECDPRPTLRNLYQHPITLLALLADHRGGVSGSQSLETFVKGRGAGAKSDFDLYLPRNPDAVMDAMHVLHLAGVTWRNYLSKTFDDIRLHKCAILPYKTLYSIAENLQISPEDISKYIQVRFASEDNCDQFARSFELALKAVFRETTARGRSEPSHTSSADWYEFVLWKYDGKTGTGAFISLCETFKLFTYDMLKQWSKKSIRSQIELQKCRWKDLGLPEAFFSEYVLRRLRTIHWQHDKCMREISTKNIDIPKMLKKCFPEKHSTKRSRETKESTDRNVEDLAHVYHGFDFYMLQGTLQNGTKVQLMLFPPNETLMHIVLKFYATNVRSYIGGDYAVHLNHDSAKNHISYLLDVSDDAYKHKHSFQGRSKYEDRGWTFKETPKEEHLIRRTGKDEKVKMIDYEEIYRSALRSQCGDAEEIPTEIKKFFQRRRDAFDISSWVEREGKVEHIDCQDYEGDSGSDHRPAGVLNWVHDALAGHKDVARKADWENREGTEFVLLDLWFGGAGALAIHMGHRLGNIHGAESDLDATLVESEESDGDESYESDESDESDGVESDESDGIESNSYSSE